MTSHTSENSRTRAWNFFWLLAMRDLKTRYAGSALGGLWNLIHPIVMILIYIVIFSSLLANRGGAEAESGSYVIHLCAGMLVWLVFAEVLNRSVSTLLDNSTFLQKISFPPLLLHGSVLFNVLFIYGVGLIALIVILWLMGRSPTLSWLGVFPIMAMAGVAASGLGMVLSAAHVFFRDIAQVVVVVLQLGFWFNPIVYPKSLIQDSSLGPWVGLLSLNPIEHFVSSAQALFGSPEADPWRFAPVVIVVFPIVCVIVGVISFQRMLPDVRDNL